MIDSQHLLETVRLNLPQDRSTFLERLASLDRNSHLPAGTSMGTGDALRITDGSEKQDHALYKSELDPTRLALVSTIQFSAALQCLKDNLSASEDGSMTLPDSCCSYEATIPRSKPLSPGEILGCTAPTLQDVDALV